MKKILRIIIPIILALVIVLGTLWYFFVYDREFTRDMLLQSARFFEGKGSLKTAAWFYDRAYEMVSDNDSVAIELAQQYKDDGNYTKAEYVLSHALEDGGGVELYAAMCRTYVAQDKLLDAVYLLDNIKDPDMKAQLDAIRPSAPAVIPEPGFYNQYIGVTFTGDAGNTICVNPHGEYPTLRKNTYTEPITLSAGENTLYALAIAPDGLVSPLSIYSYTVGGVIELVEFQDAAIENAVRSTLGVSAETAIYTNDLWQITSFTVPEDTETFADLTYLPYLEELTITDVSADGLSAISGMSQLKTLTITGTPVSSDELAVIGSLPKLQKLTLQDCRLTTTAGLAGAVNLEYLDLSENTVRNIDALSQMTKLKELYLQGNALVDLDALSGLKSLTELNVARNTISSIAPVGNLTGLSCLDISQNQVSSLEGINQLSALTVFRADNNTISDISSLASCQELLEVLISTNSISDLSPLSGLSKLTSLDFSHNEATELPDFSEDSVLVTINGSHNEITDLSALSGLKKLNSVYMDYNPELESVAELEDCPVLVLVNVFGTKVTEVKMLTNQSVVVNFDPTLA